AAAGRRVISRRRQAGPIRQLLPPTFTRWASCCTSSLPVAGRPHSTPPRGAPPITAPPRIPEVPRPLWRTVGACLRADPTTRPMAAQLAEQLVALGSSDRVPAVLPPDGVPPDTSDDQLGWPATPVEPDELPTPVRKPQRPEVAQAFASEVRSRWIVGLPAVV